MRKIMIVLTAIAIISIGLFIGLMAFTWRTDLSHQPPYSAFLNTPLEFQAPYAIVKEDPSGRFKSYSLIDYSPSEDYQRTSIKKVYGPGDKIRFYAAKSYYSIHVGTTYYLLGKDTLDSGEAIEFEYYLTNNSPRLWETLEAFLERRKQEGH